MSNCASVSSIPKTLQPQISCIQQPLTKAALFVIAFLLAGGAAASYFTVLGIAVTAAFSAASLVTFITACIVTARCPVPPSVEELVGALPSFDFLKGVPNSFDWTPQEEEALDALFPYVEAIFGETVDKTALQSLINYAAHDHGKLFMLVTMCIIDADELDLNSIAFAFDELQWPNEEIKKQTLIHALTFIMIERDCINFPEEDDEDEYSGDITILTKKIFGKGDFCQHPERISPLVSEAVGVCIKLHIEIANQIFENEKHEGEVDLDREISITLHFQQVNKCLFPASVLRPTLPYLKNLPWVVAFDFSEIGNHNEYGFQDEDADLLLELLKTNPRVVEFKVNTQSMSSEKRAEFEREKDSILTSRNNQL